MIDELGVQIPLEHDDLVVEEWLKFLQLAMGLLGACGLLPRRCPCYGKPTSGWAPSLETEYGGEEEETLDVESSRRRGWV